MIKIWLKCYRGSSRAVMKRLSCVAAALVFLGLLASEAGQPSQLFSAPAPALVRVPASVANLPGGSRAVVIEMAAGGADREFEATLALTSG